ncbi:MAG TPA: hypothetical protein VN973_14350 [Candidatus Dormibacteraeota bacterium]|nr:hypothetical protein [Candidatus Dormibacteraeota bacterium]
MIEIESAKPGAQLVPLRLAHLRLQVLDLVLDDLEYMRLEGVRMLPPDVSALIADLARAHDGTLQGVPDAPGYEITIAEDQLLEAQGQIMLELASLGGGATWVEAEIA